MKVSPQRKKSAKLFPHQTLMERYRAKELAVEIIEWAKRPDAIKVWDFAIEKGFNITSLRAAAVHYPEFNEAVEQAKYIIGSRREKLALQGELHPGIVQRTMGMYDKDYRDLLEWEFGMKDKPEASMEPQLVVLEKFPGSSMVPAREGHLASMNDDGSFCCDIHKKSVGNIVN